MINLVSLFLIEELKIFKVFWIFLTILTKLNIQQQMGENRVSLSFHELSLKNKFTYPR